MENKKEDKKEQSISDKNVDHREKTISESELEPRFQKKIDELSQRFEKNLLKAKLLISEKRVAFLLGILTLLGFIFALLGIVYPIYMTERSKDKVDNAIQTMESRFKELAGEYLRKPEIVCDISGKNLLNNSLTVGWSDDKTSQTFKIKNIGNAPAGMTYIYLYLKHKEDNLFLAFDLDPHGFQWTEIFPNDDTRYYTKLRVCIIAEFHAGRELDFRFKHSIKIDSPLEVPAMLKIYYSGPNPIEVPFTMRFIPKENKK